MSIYNTIGANFTLYFGSACFFAGIIGNILNASVFLVNNLQNPSIFLLFVSSCASLVYLCGSLLIRVLLLGFDIKFFSQSFFWCKLRVHVGQIAWFISISCICYAIIDRFFVSSRERKWRQRSQISTTRRITIFIIFFWFCHALPILLHPDDVVHTDGRWRCNSLFVPYFSRYVAYFVLPILATAFPVSILILFGLLTYHNLNSIISVPRRQRIKRPLTSMILLQTLFVVVASTPLAVCYMYEVLAASMERSIEQRGLESLILDIALVLYGFPHASSFFTYSLSSATYRRQVQRLLHLSSDRERHPRSRVIVLAGEHRRRIQKS